MTALDKLLWQKRDKHMCQICGDYKYIEIHHKDSNKENNKENNLITLCSHCHKKVGKTKIVAVLSGGADSCSFAVYCSEVLQAPLYIIVFQYGQRATKEIEALKKIFKNKENVKEIKVIDITSIKELLGENQLTNKNTKVEDSYTQSVVVPFRNGIFLSIASAWAYSLKANYVIFGAHMSDSGKGKVPLYPDCTPEFQYLFEKAIYKGHYHFNLENKYLNNSITITSPARLEMEKLDLLKLGYQYLGDKIFDTWSCYKSEEKQCGKCESCNNRKKAFELAKIEDKTEYTE